MALDPSIKAVGFDMDGTFMHTYVDYVKLANVVADVFREMGVPTETLQRDHYKLTMEACMQWMRDHGKADELPDVNQRIGERATEIEMENSDRATVFPGAEEVLDILKSKGYRVGILTRGGRRYATKVLGSAGVLEKFDALVARDDYPEDEAKPNPIAMDHLAGKMGVTSEQILYLGDGIVDWMTADRAGSQFIGVETGRTKKAEWIEKAGKDVRVIPSIADLKGMI